MWRWDELSFVYYFVVVVFMVFGEVSYMRGIRRSESGIVGEDDICN